MRLTRTTYRDALRQHEGISFINNRILRKAYQMNLTVYRLENEEREGPFRNCSMTFKKRLFKPSRLLFLRPDEDFPIASLIQIGFYAENANKNLRFGCASFSQLRRWLEPGDFERLKREGYRVVKYKVKQAIVSDNQCIYNLQHAERLSA
jgi:hypothetical protein